MLQNQTAVVESPRSTIPDLARSASLVEVLRRRVWEEPQRPACTFLGDGETESAQLRYGDLDQQARAIAAHLQLALQPGDRALLLYPPGLDFVAAFLGCLYAGTVAVPTFPPRSRRADARLRGIAADAEPGVVLTDSQLLPAISGDAGPGAGNVAVIATDRIPTADAEGWREPHLTPEDTAFLQYTSGSTAAPKGVVVTHGNLVHNQEMIRRVCAHDEESVIVSWLPPYHDMGLIAGLLQPIYAGGLCVLMSPTAFLQKPVRWLEAVTRYRGNTSGGPNFAYDLCVRKVTAEQRRRLDLSSWRVAFNGAEPVRAETVERFARVFAGCGFDRRASYPCYGLAEATLLVTGGDRDREPPVEWFDPDALEEHRVAPVCGMRERVLVSCGRPGSEQQLRIVDPDSRRECASHRVGEIWVAGPSVARGYWRRPEETAGTFGARLADDERAGPFLRTGDLGFVWEGELFVTGRLKDLIIIRGRNHYPQDLELTAGQAHAGLRPGGGAAFAVEAGGEERLVVVHEVRRGAEVDVAAIADGVRRAIAEEHEVHAWDVVLIPAGTLPKTSSGKVRRRTCRAAYLKGELPALGSSRLEAEVEAVAAEPALSGKELRALPSGERLPRLTELLRARLAQVLGTDPARLEPTRALTALGLDSLRAVELSTAVEEQLGTAPSQARLLEGASLQDLAEELVAALDDGAERVELAAAPATTAEHPLSRGQRALWFLEQLTPGTTAFMLAGALRLRGELDREALERALGRLVARHPALRTTFHEVAGEPRQTVRDAMGVKLIAADAADPSVGALRERLATLACRPFDDRDGPLFRLALLPCGAGEQVLLVTIHHAISDLWSIGIFLDELEALYREETGGPAAQLPELPRSYADYVHGQEAMLASERGRELRTFWQDRLSGELRPLDLPTDRPRSAAPAMRGALESLRFDAGLLAAVEALGRRHGATLFMTLTAALQVLLHRYTAADEVLVGAPTTGRGTADLRRVIGYFVNPVVLRAELAGDPACDGFLERTRQAAVAAFAHQDCPFPLLAERLQPERDPSRAPIFQVMLVLQQTRRPGLAAAALGEEGASLELFGLPCESLRLPCRDSQLDLTLYAAPWADGLGLALEYAAELFDAASMRRFLGHFRALLRGMTSEPGRRLSELTLLNAPERAQLLVEWNDTGSTGPAACLHELIEAQVRRTPKATAVVCGKTGARLTYRQLERRSAALAARLRALGVAPEVRVGVCMPRTPELVVALLGVLRAGGAYVPIDPEYPAERRAFMLEDSGARVLVSHGSLWAGKFGNGNGPEIVFIDELSSRAPAGATAGTDVDPRNLSHLIYTSGSTGRPKGVAIRHAAAAAMVRWALASFAAEELRGVLLSTSVCFDISVFEIFVPLACGGAVIVAENALELPALAVRDQVTLINTVPSAMTELVRQGAIPPSVRTVNLAGEPLKRELVDGVYGCGTVDRVCNLYGPSEDTTYTTWVRVPRAGKVTIGRPVTGTRACVLDRARQPVPPGAIGELYLAGEGLARGYLDRPALTAERFVPAPTVLPRGARMYCTGDLVRYRPDGELEFIGRRDHQVKVRGYRIELGEIESALLAHPTVHECVVVVRDEPERGAVLVAYVGGAEEKPPTERLREFLHQRLPEPMVPAAFVVLDRLPLLPNGKVNRRALPAPDWSALGRRYQAPRTPEEELLAGIWAEVLRLERVGIADRFFELGGHSLLATQVLSRVRQAFGVELPVRALFEAPTVAELGRRIAAARGARPTPPIRPLPRRGHPVAEADVLSFAQERLWFLDQLESGSAFYNIPLVFRLTGPLGLGVFRAAIDAIVGRHESLRTTFGDRGGRPYQRIASELELTVPAIDVSGLGPEPRAAGWRVATAEIRRPFDLGRGPLVRVELVRMAPEEHLMILCCHHVVFDGWSAQVFLGELVEAYESFAAGRRWQPPPLRVQYADYAAWQREWLQGAVLDEQLAYWRRQLAGLSGLELPTDRPRPPVETFRGTNFETALSEPLTAGLHALANREGVTGYMVLLAAFFALLRRYSGQDAAVGSPIANRGRAEIEGVMGFFANTLVLRCDLSDAPSCREILARVRETCLDGYAHQDLPFEKLVEEIQPQRDMSRNPLFQVMLVLENQPGSRRRTSDLTLELIQTDPGTAKFDLIFFWWEEDEGRLDGLVEYNTDLFDGTTVRRLLGHYVALLQAMTADAGTRPDLLPLLSPAERHHLLYEWNDTRTPGLGGRPVHRWVEEQARLTPEAVALVDGARALTYGELDARANQLAWRLRKLGVGPERLVGICVERSAEMLVGFLAVLKAGGAGVALDPAYPKERISAIIRDAEMTVLLTQDHLLAFLPEHAGENLRLTADWSAFAAEPTDNPGVGIAAENPIYAIYTSGSTGEPKGILVTHGAFANLVDWQLSCSALARRAKTVEFATFGFCVSFQEMFTAWCSGGSLVMADEMTRRDVGGLAAFLAGQQIERLHMPFAALKQLAEVAAGHDVLPSRLKEVITAGEQLQVSPSVRGLFERLPGCSLHNQYGASETHVVSAHTLFGGPDRWRTLPPAGRPVANVRIHLLDAGMAPVPVGVTGWLHTAGACEARGYLNDPVTTAQKFVPDPFSPVPGGRLYRTGDLARFLADGEIEYFGRGDDQVKIRGFRVELGEVETALARHPRVRDAAVVARDGGAAGKRLVAYVVPSAAGSAPEAELRAALETELPEYMVPSAFVFLAGLPLNANGKLDRENLPEPEWGRGGGEYVAPRTPTEEVLAGIWAEVLGFGGDGGAQVGAEDNFFELGGHSLLATQVTSRLRQAFAAEVALRELFSAPTLSALAAKIDALRHQQEGVGGPPIVPVGRDRDLPPSFAQQRLWFLDLLDSGKPHYNICGAVHLAGALDAGLLHRSLNEIVRRHEALRTTFVTRDEALVQVIAPRLHLELPRVELGRLGAGDREAEARRLAAREARQPFDLARGPLVRVRLLRLAASEHILVLTMHHIISDGWSLGVLLRELRALGAGVEPAPLPVQYADFAVWQRQWLGEEQGVAERELAWWREELAGARGVLELPTDRPRPSMQSLRGAQRSVRFAPELVAELTALARSDGATLFMALLAGLDALLHRYTADDDVLVGSPVAGRNRQETEGLIGLFVNTLVLRARVAGELSLRELLSRVRTATLGAYDHQDLPFEQLVEALDPKRDLSRSPLFQVMMALQNEPLSLELPGLVLTSIEVDPGTARFDLELHFWETAGGLVGFCTYDQALFDATTVERLLRHYRILLAGIVAEPDAPLAALPWLSRQEEQQLVVEWNVPGRSAAPAAALHELILAQAARTPGAPAVVCAATGAELTYAELERESAAVAACLSALGVGPEVRAGVCLPRTPDLVVALLGVLRAGGAYVPIDPAYPAERQAFMLEDSQARVLVSHSNLRAPLPGKIGNGNGPEILLLDKLPKPVPVGAGPDVDPRNLSHLIYTSGSTGVPKGVAICHAAAVEMVRWALDVFDRVELRGVLASTSVCFDISVFEIFVPLACGGSAIVAENVLALGTLARRDAVTLINTVPSAMAELVRQGGVPESVRTVNLAGEPLRRRLVDAVYAIGSVERVLNLYGPSEDTTYSTWVEVPRGGGRVTIGRPVAGTRGWVLDGAGRPVAMGVVGELCLAGEGLARGYLDRPALTAERFVPWRVGVRGTRMYRTGDLVRYRPDGELDFVGRIDHQVKVRGLRIELGEIEAALLAQEGIRQCVVVARDEGERGAELVAYVVGEELENAELAAPLRRRLPDYMVPSAFVELTELPLLPNGKVDRKALPAPERKPKADYAAPRSPSEEVLAGIWAEVLGGRDRIGIDDDFFQLGGHSLLGTRVASRVREAFGVELPLRRLFEAPTVAGLAAWLDQAPRPGSAAPPLGPVSRDQQLRLSFAQERLWFLDQLVPGGVAYAIPAALWLTGEPDVPALRASLGEIVRRHEPLRTTFVRSSGGPVQIIAPPAAVALPVVDLGGLGRAPGEAEVARLARREARRPFDLARGPLLRTALLRLDPRRHVLFTNQHHMISDGWSVGIFLRELSLSYRSFSRRSAPELPPLPVRYADCAAWQREWLVGEALERRFDYWRRRLAGAPAALELPPDRPRPRVQSERGGREPVALAAALRHNLVALASRLGATPFMVLLAAFKTLLRRYTGETDLLVGTPVAGRTRAELEPLIGLFVNTLVLRTDLAGNPRFSALVARVREVALEAYAHQELPFEKLVGELRPERDTGRAPLVQVMFTLQNAPLEAPQLPGLEVEIVDVETGTAKLDGALTLIETAAGLTGTMEYNRDLFDPGTIRRLVGHWQRLLAAAIADPQRRLAELALLAPGERHQLLAEWNDTRWPPAPGVTLHGLFERQAERTPEAVAVVCDRRPSVRYRQLDRRANRLAHHLRRLGVGPERIVGVAMERSPELVVSLLAILKAGGAYLPLDVASAPRRLAFIIADAGVGVVVADAASAARLPQFGGEVVVPAREWDRIRRRPAAPPPVAVSAESLAYVLYTSGSTGEPKGALISQRSIVHHMLWMQRDFPLAAGDAVLQRTPFFFDASVWEFFAPLAAGARLVLAAPGSTGDPSSLVAELKRRRITIVQMVPSLLEALVEEPGFGEGLAVRRLFSGGEPLKPTLRDRCQARCRASLINLYGPTEATIQTVVRSCRPGEPYRTVPIGRPIANTRIHLLDPHCNPVPAGVAGELCIASPAVARGYLGRPVLSAEKFVPNPFAGSTGERLYRTGDLARYAPDGVLEMLGRLDHQVKLRGFRIELGEIEAALARRPGVREAAVVVASGGRAEGEAAKRLVAYVTARVGAELSAAALRAALRDHLPDHMIPAFVVTVEALPLTPGGKVDRRALAGRPRPVVGGVPSGEDREAPRTAAEEIVSGIWADVLGRPVSRSDHFFELGGHSLLATGVISRIRETFGVTLPLRTIFEAPTVAALAARLGPPDDRGRAVPIPVLGREPGLALPLSFAQERLWFLDQLDPGRATYNVCSAVRLSGRLDAVVLDRSLNEIVRRHEALRTTFIWQEGGPRQVIAPRLRLGLPVIDLERLSAPGREGEARRLAEDQARQPFDLARGPLVRVGFLRLAAEEHVVVVNIHHIVSDGWSMGVLMRELGSLCAPGGSSSLPALPVQYADFAVWQRRRLSGGPTPGEVLTRELAWWRRQLEGAREVLELPADRPRPPLQSFRGGQHPIRLSPDLSRELTALARRRGATLFMVLLAGFDLLLHRYTGQEDVLVGSPVAQRTRPEIEGLIGFFVNTLVLRAQLAGDPPFGALLAQLREVTLGAWDHQELPFEQLVEELRPERDMSRSPLFQVVLALQNAPLTLEVPGLILRSLEIGNGTSKFDLTVSLAEGRDGLSGVAEYSRDLFDATTIARLVASWQALLAGVVADPEQRLSAFPLLTAAERHHLLVEWNDVATLCPRASIHELFVARARQRPDAVALVGGEAAWTYAGLDRRTDVLAAHLRRRGVGPEVMVAVSLERSPELIMAILAVLKAGGAYLPLEPELPRERRRVLLDDARVAVVVTRKGLVGDPGPDGPEVVCVEDLSSADGGSLPPPAVGPDNLAYVMVTSGSTGVPKGVAVPHRAVVRLVRETNYLRFGCEDVFLHLAPIAFDASTLEVWGPLLNGGRLVIHPAGPTDPRELGQALRRHRVTTLWLTAGLFHLMVDERAEDLAGVKNLLAGGDVLSPEHVRRMLAEPGERVLINGYGPTENTTFTCCHPMRGWDAVTAPVAIGRPIANTRVFILDRQLQPVPLGVLGELFVGGDGLARGYLARPALTAEIFVPGPEGGRLYRTGDLARFRPDGTVEFAGRIDRQVKLRGFRIEPGEIEAVLGAHPGVEQVAVVACDFGPQDRRLVAFLVACGEASPELTAELRQRALRQLPEYMVPAHMTWLEALPLTPNGKLDRAALGRRALAEAGAGGPQSEYVAPRDAVEQTLAAIWAEILGMEQVSIRDGFFDLGGHSLLAVRLMGEIRRHFGTELPLATLFQQSTVERLARLLRDGAGPALELPLVEIQPGDSARPRLHCIHAGGGNVLTYHDLARELGSDYPVYGLQARGLLAGEGPPRRTVGEMADAYLEAVLAAQPHGPYFLLGYCFGGLVAWEMAVRLAVQGREVALVALLDVELRPADARVPEGSELILNELGRLIELTREELEGLSPEDQHALAMEKLKAAAVAPSDYTPDDLRRSLSVVQGARYAWRDYEPPVLPSGDLPRVVLFRAGEELDRGGGRALGWDEVVGERLEIRVVPGDHATLIGAPHISVLARQLRRLMQLQSWPGKARA